MPRPLFAFFALLWFSGMPVWAPPNSSVTIRIDVQEDGKPFPHFWEQMFGSGRAALSMRESYRRDLRLLKAATGVEYIRFHAIFHDELGMYDEDAQGNAVYNFSYIDQIYDGLRDAGVRPFVELGFMPRKLAASDAPHPFWYKPLPSPPKNYGRWGEMVYAFVRHLRDRYGADEVARWYFEVWNEPNLDFWTGKPAQETYWELYDQAARAVKRVDPAFRAGGPATAQAAWVRPFLDHCERAHAPVDFVTTHVYGNDSAQDVFGTNEKIPRAEMVARAARKVFEEVKASARPDLPIIWSEYNATYLNQVDVTDSAFMGPWLANNIRLCDGLTNMTSYWTFSDVFEEQGVVKTPFYGGYGLIAAGGIPKAALEAFAMLHRLGEQRIGAALQDALATRRGDGTIAIALWNYAEAGTTGQDKLFRIELSGKKKLNYRLEMLDDKHGSSFEVWKAMGSPAYPTGDQVTRLRASAKTEITSGSVRQAIPVTITPHGLALLEIR